MIGGQSLTANIVTMSVFGAILMYTLSMLSLFQLRRREPGLVRPFRAPCYPWFPAIALAGALVCMGTMVWYNPLIFGLFLGFLALGGLYFALTGHQRQAPGPPPRPPPPPPPRGATATRSAR